MRSSLGVTPRSPAGDLLRLPQFLPPAGEDQESAAFLALDCVNCVNTVSTWAGFHL